MAKASQHVVIDKKSGKKCLSNHVEMVLLYIFTTSLAYSSTEFYIIFVLVLIVTDSLKMDTE